MAAGAIELGDALLELVHQSAARATPHVRNAVAWLREQAEPPEGVKLVSPDGTLYSGVAIVDRNDVIVLLAARHAPVAGPRRDPVPIPAPSPRRFFEPEPSYDDPGDGWPPDPFRTR